VLSFEQTVERPNPSGRNPINGHGGCRHPRR
jgi:hypothetical protein